MQIAVDMGDGNGDNTRALDQVTSRTLPNCNEQAKPRHRIKSLLTRAG